VYPFETRFSIDHQTTPTSRSVASVCKSCHTSWVSHSAPIVPASFWAVCYQPISRPTYHLLSQRCTTVALVRSLCPAHECSTIQQPAISRKWYFRNAALMERTTSLLG